MQLFSIKSIFIFLLFITLNSCGGGSSKSDTPDNSSSTNIDITGWIGSHDTIINFPPTANGFNFYRTSENNCDFTHVLNCMNGQSDYLTTLQITDTTTTLRSTGYYQLSNGSQQSKLILGGLHFPSNNNQRTINFNNQLWRIGGNGDVWSSNDGITWIEQTTNAGYSKRWGHQVIVFNNKIWLIGGYDNTEGINANDAWSSIDGITWIQEATNVTAFARTGHQLVIHNNKLWLIGGYSYESGNTEHKNDVWSSTNGIIWIQEASNAAFSARTRHQALSYNNKLWVIGGISSPENYLNDVWSSVDGINWIQQTNNAAFPARCSHQVTAFDSKLWLVGGSNGSALMNDIWSSIDGITWSQENINAPFSVRHEHQLVNYDTKLWLIGGYDDHFFGKDDVWSSSNGTNWTEQKSNTKETELSERINHAVTVYKNQLWLTGGYGGAETDDFGYTSNANYKNDILSSIDGLIWVEHKKLNGITNDYYGYEPHIVVHNNQLWLSRSNNVWASSDGENWILKTNNNNAFSNRKGYQLSSFNNKLWLIGGYVDSNSFDSYKNDIWSSTDGSNWIQETANASFPRRSNHQLVVDGDQLLLIGGTDYYMPSAMTGFIPIGGPKNDVWASSDGVHWSQLTNNAAFSARSHHQVVKYNNKLWLIGGSNGSDFFNDVWSSTDGITWTQQVAHAAFSSRYGHRVVSFDNRLLLIGGNDGKYKNDIWSSTDGIEWRKGFSGTFQFPQ